MLNRRHDAARVLHLRYEDISRCVSYRNENKHSMWAMRRAAVDDAT